MRNLQVIYEPQLIRVVTFFEGNRDEILFFMDDQKSIAEAYKNLFSTLSMLPEIDFPRERTVIGFCDTNGEHYCSHLINPTSQDEINLALIGYRPERKIRPDELTEIFKRTEITQVGLNSSLIVSS